MDDENEAKTIKEVNEIHTGTMDLLTSLNPHPLNAIIGISKSLAVISSRCKINSEDFKIFCLPHLLGMVEHFYQLEEKKNG